MSLPVVTRAVGPADLSSIVQLHARVSGPGRFARSSYRVREGAAAAFSPFCRVTLIGDRIIAAVRMTPVKIGGMRGALLLGPLSVDPEFANQGWGRAIVRESLEAAHMAGVRLVILVGDEAYYARLGFARVPPGQMRLPGPVDPARVLAAQLQADALCSFSGLMVADTEPVPSPSPGSAAERGEG